VRVKFSWFWKNFDQENNIFIDMLNEIGIEYKIVDSINSKSDLEFVSVFSPQFINFKRKLNRLVNQKIHAKQDVSYYYDPHELPRGSQSKKIWYTGENVRPPLHLPYDLFLSFDSNDYGERNLRMPYWYLDLGILNRAFNSRVGVESSMYEFMRNRKFEKQFHQRFANVVATNSSLPRDFVIENFRGFEIECYGKKFGKPLSFKSELKDTYKFTIAFENDYFPGYVTEKIIDAYAIGSIPIYWGGISEDKNLNTDAIIDYARFPSHEAFLDYMSFLTEEDIIEIYERPLLKEPVSLSPIIKRITDLIF